MSKEEFAIDPSLASKAKGFNPHAAVRASVWMYSAFAKCAYAAASAASLSLFYLVKSLLGLDLGLGLELGFGLGLLLGVDTDPDACAPSC